MFPSCFYGLTYSPLFGPVDQNRGIEEPKQRRVWAACAQDLLLPSPYLKVCAVVCVLRTPAAPVCWRPKRHALGFAGLKKELRRFYALCILSRLCVFSWEFKHHEGKTLFYAVLHPQRLAQEILTNEKNPGVSLEGFVCLGKGARLETSQDLLPGENLDYPFLLWSALF